jgi:tRNA U55 pseudouridine synthase TruB
MAQRRPTRRCPIAQPKARRNLSLFVEARKPDGCSTSLPVSRCREVLKRSGRVHAGTLEDIAGEFVAPGKASTTILIHR